MAIGRVGDLEYISPDHLLVIPEIRTLLKRILKVESDTLEFAGEDFVGYVTFRIPSADGFEVEHVLTVCAELAQEGLGVKADVSTWLIRRIATGLVSLQPWDFELQEEDQEEPPRGTGAFNAHADDVRPVNGWRS